MRIWSVHPKYLDAKGLVALWREGLLAQAVLSGRTSGYKNHPQLLRFKAQSDPVRTIGAYLHVVYLEAQARGYKFDRSKINSTSRKIKISVTRSQLEYEFRHLKQKLKRRDVHKYKSLARVDKILAHPLFRKISGPIESWEVIK